MKKLILIGCFLLMGSNVFSNNIDNSRAVAQQRVQCIPLGVPLTITQEENYTIDELKMLRNSIFAQLGFKFKSQDVVDEMTRRGCLRSDLEFSADKLQTIDKKNVLILKGWEAGLEETNQALVFQMEWKKSASNPVARAKLLAESYCFLNDQTGKYFGIIHFGSGKSKTTHPLNGMMSVDRPTWAKGYSKYVTPSEKDAVAKGIVDSTAVYNLNFSSKGTWSVNNTKTKSLGTVQITMDTDYKKMKNAAVNIEVGSYQTSSMLTCSLTE